MSESSIYSKYDMYYKLANSIYYDAGLNENSEQILGVPGKPHVYTGPKSVLVVSTTTIAYRQ